MWPLIAAKLVAELAAKPSFFGQLSHSGLAKSTIAYTKYFLSWLLVTILAVYSSILCCLMEMCSSGLCLQEHYLATYVFSLGLASLSGNF